MRFPPGNGPEAAGVCRPAEIGPHAAGLARISGASLFCRRSLGAACDRLGLTGNADVRATGRGADYAAVGPLGTLGVLNSVPMQGDVRLDRSRRRRRVYAGAKLTLAKPKYRINPAWSRRRKRYGFRIIYCQSPEYSALDVAALDLFLQRLYQVGDALQARIDRERAAVDF